MQQQIRRWFELHALTGAEVRLGKEGIELVNACTLQISGDEMSVSNKQAGLKNAEHFAKHYRPGALALCLTGKGILTKQVSKVAAIDQQVVQQILPNINPDDFYFQLYHKDDHSLVSAIRRTAADEVMAELGSMGFKIIGLSLGNVTENLAYSSAFQVLLDQELIEVKNAKIIENRLQVFAKAKLMGMASIFGVMLFILLLVNFFLFSHFEGMAGKLAFKRNRSGMQIKKFQQMESDVVQKAALITSAGWSGGYSFAWLTDQLMASRPQSIVLQQLNINPAKAQKATESREEVYEVKKIIIKGWCDKAATLNNWLFEIRSKQWVVDCGISDYQLNRETGKGQFTMHIEIKDYEGS